MGTGGFKLRTRSWDIGHSPFSRTWRIVLRWLNGEVRSWTQEQVESTQQQSWEVVISLEKALEKLVTSEIFRLSMDSTSSCSLNNLPLSPPNPVAMISDQTMVERGKPTFTTGVLVEALVVHDLSHHKSIKRLLNRSQIEHALHLQGLNQGEQILISCRPKRECPYRLGTFLGFPGENLCSLMSTSNKLSCPWRFGGSFILTVCFNYRHSVRAMNKMMSQSHIIS